MRAALLVTLVALAGSARADNCKDDKQKLANFFRDVDKLGADAMQLAAKCIYEGSDDAGLDKLVKAMKTLSPPEGRASTCRHHRLFAGLVEQSFRLVDRETGAIDLVGAGRHERIEYATGLSDVPEMHADPV